MKSEREQEPMFISEHVLDRCTWSERKIVYLQRINEYLLFTETNNSVILTVTSLFILEILKIINERLDLFSKFKSKHGYSTCNNSNNFPHYKLKLFENSPLYMGIWQ
jgi:hypothetical protein